MNCCYSQARDGLSSLPTGDFPDVARYREILSAYDITQFPKLKDSMLKAIEDSLSVDIPSLVRQFDNPYA